MKRILDPAFRYRPSYDTDVRKTFEAARREQAGERLEASEPANDERRHDATAPVLCLLAAKQ